MKISIVLAFLGGIFAVVAAQLESDDLDDNIQDVHLGLESAVLVDNIEDGDSLEVDTPGLRGHRELSQVGWKTFRNSLNAGYCMDLKWGNTANFNAVQVYWCNGTNAQWWYFDSLGRIRSGVNHNKCLEAGRGGGLYSKMFIHDCHHGTHQRWWLLSNGRIQNKAHYTKYIGVAGGGDGIYGGDRLELHDLYSSGTIGGQQQWVY